MRERWCAGMLWLAIFVTGPSLTSAQSPPRRPLADDLPDPRWGQSAARLLRCCDDHEVLVQPPDPDDLPSCQPAPDALRWRPRLLNARTGRRGPPDRRFTVLHTGYPSCVLANLSAFWLDGARPGQRFELLTSGQLYQSEVDVLYPATQFCAGRMVAEGELVEDGADQVTLTEAAIVCNVSMHDLSSVLDAAVLEPTCRRGTCFRKCCPRGMHMDRRQECLPLPANNSWRPEFHTSLTRPARTDRYRTLWGNALCPETAAGRYGRVFSLQPFYRDADQFYLQTNGSLWAPGQGKMADLKHFCVDQMLYTINDTNYYHQFAILCFGDPPPVAARHRVLEALLSVSAALLLVTFVIYAAIPELRNVHGRCLMSQVAALFTAYLCRIGSQAAVVYRSLPFCQATAIVMYYSFLAVCFWLNTMSFDIWRTFSRVHAPAVGGGSKTRRFVRYSLYSWLSPLALTAVTVFMQFAPEWLVPTEIYLRPGFGDFRCWFPMPGRWEMLAYLHGPLLVLMTANLVLFVMTAYCLLRSEQDIQLVRKKKTAVERLKIYVNLFIVMGITWIAEALSVHLGNKVLWYVSDIINCLQGLIIFLLFTMRQRSRHIILRHLDSWRVCRWCRCCRRPAADGSQRSKTCSTSLPRGSSGRSGQTHELEPVMAAAASDNTPVNPSA